MKKQNKSKFTQITLEMQSVSTPKEESSSDEHKPLFLNQYKCPECGHAWVDYWDCACGDDCPQCGKRHITPYESNKAKA